MRRVAFRVTDELAGEYAALAETNGVTISGLLTATVEGQVEAFQIHDRRPVSEWDRIAPERLAWWRGMIERARKIDSQRRDRLTR